MDTGGATSSLGAADVRFTYATPDTVLSYGDVILVLGRIDDVERFAETD